MRVRRKHFSQLLDRFVIPAGVLENPSGLRLNDGGEGVWASLTSRSASSCRFLMERLCAYHRCAEA